VKTTNTSKTSSVTMADLLAKSKTSIKNLSMGQRIKGKVIQKLSKSLILDISGKAEGVVMEKAFGISSISTVREESHPSDISRSLLVESIILGKVRHSRLNGILWRSTPGDYHR